MEQRRAIVIGGGVIGCMTAYYLRKFGWEVCLVEAGTVGKGCSHGNCGYICPSHVLPLTMPGAVWKVLRQMASRDSPLYVKPRLDPALWAWLARFAAHCRAGQMMKTAHARHALLASSMALYRKLIADESLAVEWEDRGLLLVFRSSQEFDSYAAIADLVRREFDVAAVPVAGNRLNELEPTLRDGMAGAWHYPGDAHLRPDALLSSMAALLRRMGVEIQEGVSVKQINIEGGVAHSIQTSTSKMEAQAVVLAAGAETPTFARHVGCRIPIQPGKGYSITMSRPAVLPRHPMIFEEYHVAVTPWQSGLRIGSTMEFVGYDRSLNLRRLKLFERAAREYLVEPPNGPIEEKWFGWRPMTYDDLPVIGPAAKAPNLVIAAGHGMIGMASATASGKLAAELVNGSRPHIDPTPYALSRFGG
jgi:D-amino-acid dehydrogenase